MGTASPNKGQTPVNQDDSALQPKEQRTSLLGAAFTPAAEGTDEAVKAVHKKAREQFEEDRKAVQGEQLTGDSARAGRILVANAAVNAKTETENKKRRERATRDHIMLLLNQRLSDLNRQLDTVQGAQDAIEDVLNNYSDEEIRAGEHLNPDGTLKDAEAEAALRAYEEEYGIKIDRSDPEVLRRIQIEMQEQKNEIQEDIKATQEARRELKQLPEDASPQKLKAVIENTQSEQLADIMTQSTTAEIDQTIVEQVANNSSEVQSMDDLTLDLMMSDDALTDVAIDTEVTLKSDFNNAVKTDLVNVGQEIRQEESLEHTTPIIPGGFS